MTVEEVMAATAICTINGSSSSLAMDVERSCCCGESVCLIVYLRFIDGWASTGKQQQQQQKRITEKRCKTIRQPQPSCIRAATTKDAHQAV
jgi:hypothetical protein